MRAPRFLVALALVVVAAAGCSSSAPSAKPGTCLGAVGSGSPAAAHGAAGVSLDCFDGSGSVRLAQLTTPAVVNLWAGWCAPCRKELPEVQKFATAAQGKVAVVGVDSADTKTSGSSVIADRKLTYPMLFDPEQKLGRTVGQSVLPVTLFIRPGGDVAYVYQSQTPLDSAKLAELAHRYLGVQVAA